MARKSKKSAVEVVAPVEATSEVVAQNEQAAEVQEIAQAEAAQAVAETQPVETEQPVEQVAVARSEKITGISKANYKANLDRANELKGMLREYLTANGTFPSHRFIQKNWGFNISLKAIIRHKSKIAQAQGLDKVGTGECLPRPKKAKVEVAPEAVAE